MRHFPQTLASLTLLIGLILGLTLPAAARESVPQSSACPADLTDLLSDVTIYGTATWGENWAEYHHPDGTTILASGDFSDLKRGTWSSAACLEVCYEYTDGGGWCPTWQEADGGWVNLDPNTGEVIHYIYLFQSGDILNLTQMMERRDALAHRI